MTESNMLHCHCHLKEITTALERGVRALFLYMIKSIDVIITICDLSRELINIITVTRGAGPDKSTFLSKKGMLFPFLLL